jgi:3'(2'), 5'-bisphosphate nucleotidase
MKRQKFDLLPKALAVALQAGKEILHIYHSEFDVSKKADTSPLTLADTRAHEIIQNRLSAIFPLLSEEGSTIPYEVRSQWHTFWLVDPLDGTKEFISRNGEFTVNIALIENRQPVMGVVLAPALGKMYFGEQTIGSFLTCFDPQQHMTADDVLRQAVRLPCSANSRPFTVVASRSHLSPETKAYVDSLRKHYGELQFISAGSSLKMCLVAEGRADVYPRLSPTMEWDTASGHAIAVHAGRSVLSFHSGQPLTYNKPDLRNEWFIVQ